MSEAYKKVSAGRLTFKGGDLATRSKSITKKSKSKKKKSPLTVDQDGGGGGDGGATEIAQGSDDMYTIDPMKKMKYDELFPVECKKFGYDPKAKASSVEQALDDRVKKKADRYCK